MGAGQTQIRQDIWNSRLDAKMNAVYVKALLDRQTWLHIAFAIAIPVLSGGTLAVWLSKLDTILYPIIGILVALLSAIQSALKLYEAVPKLKQVYDFRLKQENQWDKLWTRVDSLSLRELQTEYDELRNADTEIEKLESEFIERPKLVKKAQEAVRLAEGLWPPKLDNEKPPALPPGNGDVGTSSK